ncbi:peptidoglycan editing factor PgeF [Polynucleobacter sp. AP-Sving-400A-A2]|uniref:peptidoglycan editing factor PgeF n=1 Tax=Polynucleobacter sp. AP-Sving-400A-A2 TaxID=2081049 RepID=UPI001BFDEF3B|nr:peptidoglycan editing factor PgeF [Polynucleobacter sp. AP-Sving-400A-A2]QWE15541.1 peptidoglycan editing factor PgeF [Polynucleobacter sp. AP-Sving-400A-A2]
MTNAINKIEPSWAMPQQIQAFCTTRQGGISKSPFNSLNLGLNAGDDSADVLQNRSIVRSELPSEPLWLKQIHGVTVSTPASRNSLGNGPFEADAAVTNIPNEVLAILAADCMPVLFASRSGEVIGAAHAGWRGLSGGVLENTIDEMIALSTGLMISDISVWLGPAIGPNTFEVGEDVLQAFAQQGQGIISKAFIPIDGTSGKYLADLYLLARDRLHALGIRQITGGEFCTVSSPERFFSYRRDKATGRFASLIWIAVSA